MRKSRFVLLPYTTDAREGNEKPDRTRSAIDDGRLRTGRGTLEDMLERLKVRIVEKDSSIKVEETNRKRLEIAADIGSVYSKQRNVRYRVVGYSTDGLVNIEYRINPPHRLSMLEGEEDVQIPIYVASEFLGITEEDISWRIPQSNFGILNLNKEKDAQEATTVSEAERERINQQRRQAIFSMRYSPFRKNLFRVIDYDSKGLLRMSYQIKAPEEIVMLDGEEEFSVSYTVAVKYLGPTVSYQDLKEMVASGKIRKSRNHKPYLADIIRLKQNIPKVELPTPTKSIFGDDIPEDMDGGDIEDVTADPIDRDILRQE